MEQADRFILTSNWKKLLAGVALFASILGLKWIGESFSSPTLYQKDFLQGWLLAKAFLSGVNPYLPLPQLVDIWLPAHNLTGIHHPTPHTFFIGWFCLPLAYLSYESAARVWLGIELTALAAVIVLLFRGFAVPLSWRRFLLVFAGALGWAPVMQDLWLGQFSIVLLLLLVGAWLALRQGRDWRGGMLLGGMLTLKLAAWPVVLYLVLRRRWQAVVAAGVTAGLLHLLAIGIHGWTLVQDYYLRVGPQVSAHYRSHDPNASLWTFGQRMFAEFGNNFLAQPLVSVPWLARLMDGLVPLSVLALSLYCALRVRDFDTGFAWLASVSAIVNPVAWTHYLLLTVIALGVVLRRLQALGWPRVWVKRLILICLPFCVTHPVWSLLALLFSSAGFAGTRPPVPFVAAWLTVVPTLAVLALGGLLWRVEALAVQQEHQTNREAVPWPQAESEGLAAT